ncbi:hypothetical protein ALC60_03057 [Trachymyrmex zeteki]|uniref:Uncharacterized protein n=1 Tax=Mycetomoellerius zeteki TaxID=64791 RepID=A0A151XC88_9HYME|nr:hypothetical protein ALC60_03057 [Trachymyrmex zeteki]
MTSRYFSPCPLSSVQRKCRDTHVRFATIGSQHNRQRNSYALSN